MQYFRHGCQNVLENANRFFFAGEGVRIVNHIEYMNRITRKPAQTTKNIDQLVGLHNLISMCVDRCQHTIINSGLILTS